MKYSVIIPIFNRLPLLKRALDSVFAQTLSAKQVIVVDDGSTDGSAGWVQKHYPQVEIVRQNNAGVSAARNAGFEKVSTDWIALLDSDDEWLPEKMQRQSDEIASSHLKVCHTEEIWIRNGVRVNAKKKHQKRRGDIFSDCLQLCAMSPSAIVLHRSIWESYGGFDESFVVCEDYDLWLRICANHKVALVEEPMIRKYGGHEDQLSRQYFGMDQYRIMAMQKLLGIDLPDNIKLPDNKVSQLRQVLGKKLSLLFKGALKHQNAELISFCEERDFLFEMDFKTINMNPRQNVSESF